MNQGSIEDYLSLITIKDFAGDSLESITSITRKAIASRKQNHTKHEMSEYIHLKFVLASIRRNQFELAKHFLPKLLRSEDKRIRRKEEAKDDISIT